MPFDVTTLLTVTDKNTRQQEPKGSTTVRAHHVAYEYKRYSVSFVNFSEHPLVSGAEPAYLHGVLSPKVRRPAREADHSRLFTTKYRNEVSAAVPPIRHAPSCGCHMTGLKRAVHDIAHRVGSGALAEMANPTPRPMVGEVFHADLHYSPNNVAQSGRSTDAHRTGG